METLALIDVVRPGDQVGLSVVECDEDRPRAEELANALSDELDDRREVDLSGEGVADLVDERQLGVALACLFERPNAGQCTADVLADEGEQVPVGSAVALVGCVGLADHDTDGGLVSLQGSAEPIALAHDADRLDFAGLDELLVTLLADKLGSSRPEDVGGRALGVPHAEWLPEVRIRNVEVHGIDVIREVDRLATIVVQGDVEVVGVHECRDRGVDLAVERLQVARGGRRFGDPVKRGLHLLGPDVFRLALLERRDTRAQRRQLGRIGQGVDRRLRVRGHAAPLGRR
jgi:hypothetical protein